MKLKQEEVSYLKQIKKSNGLSEIKIFNDIENLNNSQINFTNIKNQVNKLKRIIDLKNKKITELEIKINKYKETNFKRKFNEIGKEKDNNRDLVYIRRIIRNLKPKEEYTQTDISKEFCVDNKQIKNCLSFLKEINFIDYKVDEHAVIKYFIKEKCQ